MVVRRVVEQGRDLLGGVAVHGGCDVGVEVEGHADGARGGV
jgi:hypothetical protein